MLVIINILKNKDHNNLTLESSIKVRNPNPHLLIDITNANGYLVVIC